MNKIRRVLPESGERPVAFLYDPHSCDGPTELGLRRDLAACTTVYAANEYATRAPGVPPSSTQLWVEWREYSLP